MVPTEQVPTEQVPTEHRVQVTPVGLVVAGRQVAMTGYTRVGGDGQASRSDRNAEHSNHTSWVVVAHAEAE
jgi:hypothetical protein